jgi:GTP cyclohydrolase IB
MSTKIPDVTSDSKSIVQGTLNWVGMNQLALPMRIQVSPQQVHDVQTKAATFVDLACEQSKGIHMSRLMLALEAFSQDTILSPRTAAEILQQFISTHQNISEHAKLELNFEILLKRPALKSQYTGWKSYPCKLKLTQHNQTPVFIMDVHIPYSSTCPCSAALARQLIQEAFTAKFAQQAHCDTSIVSEWLGTTDGIVATPHSQRSLAHIRVLVNPMDAYFPIEELIDCVETTLKTPVQTIVKREDEQAFALLNGQNLMFVEDAARRLQAALKTHTKLNTFWLQVEHQESLHAHNAVAYAASQDFID